MEIASYIFSRIYVNPAAFVIKILENSEKKIEIGNSELVIGLVLGRLAIMKKNGSIMSIF